MHEDGWARRRGALHPYQSGLQKIIKEVRQITDGGRAGECLVDSSNMEHDVDEKVKR